MDLIQCWLTVGRHYYLQLLTGVGDGDATPDLIAISGLYGVTMWNTGASPGPEIWLPIGDKLPPFLLTCRHVRR